ncbi:hypothetical protein R69658_07673 [Paraburkholderia aspalathi]|uniref:Uncharacterized protein n=1 Tax=Paraburkholderia aspalathi TaxID=1324617 RepID=A0ABN7NAW8_9BURK|nr:hypothetical protein [Paraburkholderia aspalathi]MBK3823969.1 hypothetical protein [Paraburkholderia aspalathi]MBK3835810.1 hypothetical protein [Paraburkholderia aspalathi]MBK3865587.1 hypothetical protein [Paraburkholderia aspalathi]CAE6862164.1 hypothetical protein R69658_07673 [Paraburkholderia aspalathi]
MNNNVHILSVAKKPPLRGRAPALPRAAVVQMAEHCGRNVDTPEQRLARLNAEIHRLAEHLLEAIRATKAISAEVRR